MDEVTGNFVPPNIFGHHLLSIAEKMRGEMKSVCLK